jgi:eukaryotic-like serine/threonine-protein kinase
VGGVTSQGLIDPFGLVGTTLDGQYRVDAIVGEGGFGVVYRGWHRSLEQPIAIKALKLLADEPQVQEALLAKFREEARLLYTLSQASLHIVRSIDFGAVQTAVGVAPYMILEWLDGQSLAEDLENRRSRGMRGRSLDEALELLAPAAEGLRVAHHRRVAHRDVKPANFFLTRSPEGASLKVLDFGIAKILREDDQGGTKSPFASFTWLYAAPEQLDPRVGSTGLTTDVYAFALLLTELLTDRPPVEGRDVVAILKAATDPTLRPTPRQRGANVPDGVELACRRALAVDPRARFATIGDLWQALLAARHPQPTSAPAYRPSLASGPPPQRVSYTSGSVPPDPGYAPTGMAPGMGPPVGPPPITNPYSSVPSYGPPMAPPRAMSPYGPPPMGYAPMGPVGPPPGKMVPTAGSSWPVIVAVVAIVLGVLFMATCSVLHAACK